MENKEVLHKLSLREIKPTAMRELVLGAMIKAGRALSISDLEELLDTADKSTIFRTVTLFHEHHLVHCIDDGSGSLKYAVCSDSCDCTIQDQHVHFYCTKCHKTFCFIKMPVPIVSLPEGFKLEDANYVLRGLCPECSKKRE